MSTEKTLDGKTAGLIAAIANGLSRRILESRIEELLSRFGVKKIRRLLLPLVHDDYLFLLSAQTHWQEYSGNRELIKTRWFSGSYMTNPNMRQVLREAVDRKLAPHSEDAARHLCQLIQDASDRHETDYNIWAIFPFVRNGRIMVFTTSQSEIKEMEPDLDFHYRMLVNGTFFFKEAHFDRSDCFQC